MRHVILVKRFSIHLAQIDLDQNLHQAKMERRASQMVRRNSENWLATQNSAITQPFDMKNMKFNRRPVNISRQTCTGTGKFNSYSSLSNEFSAIEDRLPPGSIQIRLSFLNR